MEIISNILNIILVIGCIHGIILGVVIRGIKKGHQRANRIFSILLLLFSLGIADSIFYSTKTYLRFPDFLGLHTSLPFTYLPLFYFYVKALTSRNFRLGKTGMLHFLPAIFSWLYYLPLLLKHKRIKHAALESGVNESLEASVVMILFILQAAIYLWVIFRLLRKHKQVIQENYSNIHAINLSWLNHLLIGFLISWLIILVFLGIAASDTKLLLVMDDFIYLYIAIILFWIGYRGIKQPEIFGTDAFAAEENGTSIKKKYETSPLSTKTSTAYLERLQRVMEKEKPYQDPEITLPQLAEKLGIPPYQLSQIINEKLNQNFFKFINSHRVEDAKQMLIDPGQKGDKLLKIAFEVGFNSHTTFHRVFKELTGKTPAHFREMSAPPIT